MADSAVPTSTRVYPSPEATTQRNFMWQSGVGAVALSGITLAAAAYTGKCPPLLSRVVTYAIGGAISLLSLTVLYLLRSIDSFINKKGDRFLHAAVQDSNAKRVSWLLFFGANPNAQNFEDKTALHFACDSMDETEIQLGIMKELIKSGAHVDAVSTLKETPLHYAVLSSKSKEQNLNALNNTNIDKVSTLQQFRNLSIEKIKILRSYGALSDIERDPTLDNYHCGRDLLRGHKGKTSLGLAIAFVEQTCDSEGNIFDSEGKAFWDKVVQAIE